MGLTSIALDPKQEMFLHYLLDPRSTAKPEADDPELFKGSQNAWAKRKGIGPSTVSKWKSDPRFKQAWDEAIQKVAGGPERLQAFLEQLTDIGMGKDKGARTADRIAAIRLHLEVVGRHQPKTIIEIKDPRLAQTSDEELLKRAEQHALRIADAGRAAGRTRGTVVQMTRNRTRRSG
jgi:hypothetical protein